jgi:hypothetical protein
MENRRHVPAYIARKQAQGVFCKKAVSEKLAKVKDSAE